MKCPDCNKKAEFVWRPNLKPHNEYFTPSIFPYLWMCNNCGYDTPELPFKNIKHKINLFWQGYLIKHIKFLNDAPAEFKLMIPMISRAGFENEIPDHIERKPCLIFQRGRNISRRIPYGSDDATFEWNYEFIGGDYI